MGSEEKSEQMASGLGETQSSDDKSEQMTAVLQLMQEQMAQQGRLIEMLVQSQTNMTSSSEGAASNHSTGAGEADPAKVPKAVRPVAHLDMPEPKWKFFEHEWKRYKRLTGITGQAVVDQLIDACSEELREDLFRSMGETLTTANETRLLDEMRKLAVRAHSKLVNRHGMMLMSQADDESVMQYVARLRGQAALCDYSVPCPSCSTTVSYGEEAINDQLIRGLACKETQEEVLARGSELTTQQKIVDFVAAKESARSSHDALAGASAPASINARQSQYQRQKRSRPAPALAANTKDLRKSSVKNIRCHGCGSADHGFTFQDRKARCPIWGKRCARCNGFSHLPEVAGCKPRTQAPATQSALTVPPDASEETPDTSGYGVRASFLAMVAGAISPGTGQIPHMVHDKRQGWVQRKPSDLPYLQVGVTLLSDAHESVGHPISSSVKVRDVHNYRAVADTGAQTTAAGEGLMRCLGLHMSELMPVSQSIQSADGALIDVLGAICIRVSCGDSHTDQLCYISKSCPTLFLSTDACEQLGVIPAAFPKAGVFPRPDANGLLGAVRPVIVESCNPAIRCTSATQPSERPVLRTSA